MVKLRLGVKLLGSYLIILCLTLASGLVALWSDTRTESEYMEIARSNLPTTVAIYEIKAGLSEQGMAVRGFLLYDEDSFIGQFEEAAASVQSRISEANELCVTEESRRYLDEITSKNADYVSAIRESFRLADEGQRERAIELASAAAGTLAELNASMAQWIGLLEQHNAESLDSAQSIGRTTRTVMLAAMAITIVLCALLAILLPRGIAVPVSQVRAVADAVAAGDLTVSLPRVKTGDEIQDLNESTGRMLENLARLVRNMRQESENVSAASDELSASANESARAVQQISEAIAQMAQGANQQSASAGQTAAAGQQIQAGIDSVASGAHASTEELRKASNLVNRMSDDLKRVKESLMRVDEAMLVTLEATKEGDGAAKQVALSMEKLRETSREVESAAADLDNSSRKIGQVVQVISDIADQTNLLALNAAIEAARAGEQGRGFAVVADEVRKLAEKSLQETKAISHLIEQTVTDTGRVTRAITASGKMIDESSQMVGVSTDSLQRISEHAEDNRDRVQLLVRAGAEVSELSAQVAQSMGNVVRIVEENASAAEQMSASMSEVEKSIESVAAVSEENAAATEEVSASTEEVSASIEEMSASSAALADMAHRLDKLAAEFKV